MILRHLKLKGMEIPKQSQSDYEYFCPAGRRNQTYNVEMLCGPWIGHCRCYDLFLQIVIFTGCRYWIFLFLQVVDAAQFSICDIVSRWDLLYVVSSFIAFEWDLFKSCSDSPNMFCDPGNI